MKKILSLCLSLLMVAMLVPMSSLSVSAEEGAEAIIVETGVEYAALNLAINAAATGQTVKLLKDVTTTHSSGDWKSYVTVASNKSGLVIDFDGHTVYNQWETFLTVNNGTEEAYNIITLKNGKIIHDADSRESQPFDFNGLLNLYNYTDCTLDGMILSSGNYIQSHSLGGIVRTANNIAALNLTVKNSSILDEADFVDKYADYDRKTETNQCIGYNSGGGANVKIVLDNATLLSQYSEPLNNLNGATVDIKSAHITKVYSNLAGANYRNATVADGYYVTNTIVGDPIAELLDENRIMVPSVVSTYNEFYFLDNNIDPLAVDVSMRAGAAMRLNDLSGIRYYTYVDTAKIAALKAVGATVEMGTLIAPVDRLGGADLTLDTPEDDCVNVKYEADAYYSDDSFTGIVGSLVSIKEANANRSFIGRGYVKVTFDNNTYVSYANVNTTDNARTIAWIATQVIESGEYDGLVESAKEVVDRYAALYVA